MATKSNATTATGTNSPVWSAAGISAAVSSVLALLTAFGLDLSGEQTAAILGVANVIAQVVLAVWASRRTTPNADVVEKIDPWSGAVVAGQANDIILEGDYVRDPLTPAA